MKSLNQISPEKVTVFYDGSCPLCSAEIGYYKRADADRVLGFVDVSSECFIGDGRITRREAMARFHVRLVDGRQVCGAKGFVEVWRVIPSWRWLVWFAKIPGVVPMLEVLYRLFLRMRPLLVRGFVRSRRAIDRR